MYKVSTIFLAMTIGLVFAVSNAGAIAPSSGNIYTMGPYEASGYGATEEVAMANAQQAVEDFLDTLESNLPPGHSIMSVSYEGEWDGFEYTYTFTVWVFGC